MAEKSEHKIELKDSRARRDHATRETEVRPTTWKPSSLLPTPEPREGIEFRWVRTSMVGRADNVNASSKFREGWVPVKARDACHL